MTRVLKIDNKNIDSKKISIAAQALNNGGTVVFPTETVYGLGANALDNDAVNKIFKAKGRPSDNPLIVHIWSIEQVNELVSEIPQSFCKLAQRFWPGPLTLVMKKSAKVPDLVTAGLNTVGIRMPDHVAALSLLREANIPVAAPSANISGSPSPTKVEHAVKDLNKRVDIIIDGGDCDIGLESTVLDITADIPVILRPGGITFEQLKEVLGEVSIDKFVYDKLIDSASKPKSPGVKYKHYSPKAEVILVDGCLDKLTEEINRQTEIFAREGKNVGVIATEQTKNYYKYGNVISVGDRDNPKTIAANFFKVLRYFDSKGVEVIFIEGIDKNGIGMAVMNRMIRAAGYNVIMIDSS